MSASLYDIVALAVSASQAFATLAIAIVVYLFTKRSARSNFQSSNRARIQDLNLEIMRGEGDIVDYFYPYDAEKFGLDDTEKANVYYVYFELNNLLTAYEAHENGLVDSEYLSEAIQDRMPRLRHHRAIVEKVLGEHSPYPSYFVATLRKEL